MGDCTQNCPVAARVDALDGQLEEYQAQHSATHKEIFGRLNTLERAEAVQEVHYKTIVDKLDILSSKMDTLEKKPGKRWETLVSEIIKLLVAVVGGYLLARVGLG